MSQIQQVDFYDIQLIHHVDPRIKDPTAKSHKIESPTPNPSNPSRSPDSSPTSAIDAAAEVRPARVVEHAAGSTVSVALSVIVDAQRLPASSTQKNGSVLWQPITHHLLLHTLVFLFWRQRQIRYLQSGIGAVITPFVTPVVKRRNSGKSGDPLRASWQWR